MKTTEEKAKAYDEVVNKLRHFIAKGVDPLITRADVQDFFPELAESEGEKVIKRITLCLEECVHSDVIRDYEKDECIAWLENIPYTIDHEKREGFHLGYKACLERQGEQKAEENKGNIGGISPNWSEEDEVGLGDALWAIERARTIAKNENDMGNLWCAERWLKSIKRRVQPKQEWSEEDEQILQGIWDEILANKHDAKECEWKTYDKFLDWLKSLRPQNTYNPYKAVVESIAEMCKHYDKASHSGLRDFYDNVKVKCKDAQEYDSLYPQSRWKPSDEQMMALRFVLNHIPYDSHKEEISGLLETIKETKGGLDMKKYSREEIESGVREVIARCMQLKTDEVKNDDLMNEDIGCDSIDCVEIVMELEKEFGINIPDNEVDAAAGWTVSELCYYVEERLKERKK